MFRTISIIGIWLLYAGIFFIFSASAFSLIFVIASAVLIIWLFYSVYLVRNKLNCKIETPNHITKNEQTVWQVTFNNYSKLPIAAMKITVIFEYRFTKRQESKTFQMAIPANKEATFNVEMKHLYSGAMSARIAVVEMQDALGLFRMTQTVECEQSTVILPSPFIMSRQKSIQQQPAFYSVSAASAIHSNGEELAELKVYAPGDPVKRIHWKLSSKLDELFIKQLEVPAGNRAVMTLDFTSFNQEIEVYDQLIETVGNQLFSFLYSGREIQFALYNNGWQFKTIGNELEAIDCIKEILLKEQSDLTISENQWRQLQANNAGAILITTNMTRAGEKNIVVIKNENRMSEHELKEGTVA